MVGGNNSAAGGSAGVGQGGVLLASSIIDLTSALLEHSMGGTSFLEQDMIVTVLAKKDDDDGEEEEEDQEDVSATTTTAASPNKDVLEEDDPPCVSVVLGGGVAIASFSLPKGPRPCEDSDDSSASSSSSSWWWRVASEPYVLPLSLLSAKTRDLGSGTTAAASTAAAATNTMPSSGRGGSSRAAQETAVGLGPSVSHGMGDIIDVTYLSGYTEPTLLVLHSNPKRGGGRAWSGRLGRTAEVPLTSTTTTAVATTGDEYGDDHGIMDGETTRVETTMMPTGTKYGLTLTAISLALHQHRSVVLWSLLDALPADAWKLIPHPTSNGDGGVLVWGVNTIVYVSMGGKIKCALAANGFAKVACPPGLLPPPPTPPSLLSSSTSRSGSPKTNGSGTTAVHLEPNPRPLPPLAIQLDGASRVSFVTDNVAVVCLGNGTLHLLELHNYSSNTTTSRMYMSLFPLGHKIGGLGSVASCVSVLLANTAFHANCVSRYLGEEDENKPDESVVSNTVIRKPSPKVQARGLIFVGSRMGDCTLLAFSMNEPIRLVATDEDIYVGAEGARKSVGIIKSEEKVISSMLAGGSGTSEPVRKQPRIEKSQAVKILDDDIEEEDATDISLVHGQITDKSKESAALTRDEILRLEEEELYRMDDIDDGAAPSIVSSYNDDSDALDNEEINEDSHIYGDVGPLRTTQRSVRYLSMFHSIRALDSLTGLGPLGGG